MKLLPPTSMGIPNTGPVGNHRRKRLPELKNDGNKVTTIRGLLEFKMIVIIGLNHGFLTNVEV